MHDAEFWKGRRVLVTGHTGFKGAWLSRWLLKLGADIYGLSLPPPTQPNLYELLGLDVPGNHGDIRDLSFVNAAVAQARPEVVFHLAAQPLVRSSYERPLETYAVNVMGTAHLLEALRSCESARAIVVVTSDKCYANREWLWAYRESEALGGEDPYSSSKAATELVTHSYRASYFGGARVASARAGNVIGGGDWNADRLVPDVIRAAVAGEPSRLRNPAAVRPWQHVLEPLSGYLTLAEKLFRNPGEFASAWNFGPSGERSMTVGELVARLHSAFGSAGAVERQPGSHPHEAQFLRVDSSKSHALLGWRPKLDETAAVDWTAQWYRRWHAREDVKEFTLSQIAEYQRL